MSESKRMSGDDGKSQQSLMPFWSMFGTCATSVEPLARSAARLNLEASSLVGQRARAYMGIPQTLARCRTPMELFQAQLVFWQEAGRQYAETSQRMAATWQAMLPAGQVPGPASASEPRDYITFPDGKPETAPEERRHPGESSRRAA